MCCQLPRRSRGLGSSMPRLVRLAYTLSLVMLVLRLICFLSQELVKIFKPKEIVKLGGEDQIEEDGKLGGEDEIKEDGSSGEKIR